MFRLFLCRETKTSSLQNCILVRNKRGHEDKMDAFSQFSNRQITHSLSISAPLQPLVQPREPPQVPPQTPRPFSRPPPSLPPLSLLPPSP